MKAGSAVAFAFTLDPAIGGTPASRRRTGKGTMHTDEVAYQCWPPGRYVRVTESEHYAPGTVIAVATHNLARVA